MPKYFPTITHAMVRTVRDQQDMNAMAGTIAHIDLCFGPGDEHSIKCIGIKKMQGPVSGLTAHIPKTPLIVNGKKQWVQVIEGKAADEARVIALTVFDAVKQARGMKFNKLYRVYNSTTVSASSINHIVEEIGETKCLP